MGRKTIVFHSSALFHKDRPTSDYQRPVFARSHPVILFIFYLAWALGLTYPLILHPFSHIPLGDEMVGTVPFFNLWTLQWNIDQLMLGYPNYWNPPIFTPVSGTFAFSETQPLSAILAAPFWLAFQSPVFGYNAIVILFLTLNGWFGYWLLRSWNVLPLAAFLAGLIMQSLPFVAQEMGVLQLIAIFGFLWTLLFLTQFLRRYHRGRVNRRNIMGLILGTPVTFFTCGYYGLFSLFFLPIFFLSQLRKKHLNPRLFIQLIIAGLLIVIVSGPFLFTQKQHLDQLGFTRTAQTIENNSAKLRYYFNYLDYNLLYGKLLGQESGSGQRLFPGIGLFMLAVLGLFGRAQPRIKLYLVFAVLLALLLSLGLRLRIGDLQPYQWIRDYVPGFLQLRSPFRFAVFVQLHLTLLAGFGLSNLQHWFHSRKMLSVLVAVLVIIESLTLPLPLQSVPDLNTQTEWQAWLLRRGTPAQIVMLPFAPSNRVADFEQTTRWMLEYRHFGANMVNGYSGFFPPDHGYVRKQMLAFSTHDGIDLLHDLHVDYVVVHNDYADAPAAEVVAERLPLVYHDEQANVSIFSLSQN